MSEQSFWDLCIHTKSSNPFMDDGFRWCRLKEGYEECDFKGKWNECQHFLPVRLAIKEMK